MALFFDAEWFDAKIASRETTRQELADHLGITLGELGELWKDQRELKSHEVLAIARFLGSTVQEIADRAGVSTPCSANPDRCSGDGDQARRAEWAFDAAREDDGRTEGADTRAQDLNRRDTHRIRFAGERRRRFIAIGCVERHRLMRMLLRVDVREERGHRGAGAHRAKGIDILCRKAALRRPQNSTTGRAPSALTWEMAARCAIHAIRDTPVASK